MSHRPGEQEAALNERNRTHPDGGLRAPSPIYSPVQSEEENLVAAPEEAAYQRYDHRQSPERTKPAQYQARLRLASDEPPEICTSCSVYTGTF
jgi:hypothetical protein